MPARFHATCRPDPQSKARFTQSLCWWRATSPGVLSARSIDSYFQVRQGSLDIFWLRDESLEESDNLPDPDVLAQEIVEYLEATLAKSP
jgi:type I restriction enzyme M protein